jgi:hypothetical protein
MSGRLAAPTCMRLILFLLLAAPLAAAPRHFSSGENRTHLLELFSSEGCSSCPPAEAWLGNLRKDPGLWRDFVPVAFAVDYWNRLGWTDRFARPEFTARQQAYAGQWGADTVYTPEFVLDGRIWRKPGGQSAPAASGEKAGVLSVERGDDGVCQVRFGTGSDLEVHVALLGGGISTAVRAGENAGRTLRHDFVVLQLATAQLASGRAEISLPEAAVPGVTVRALAVWVTRRGELAPRQATGGWLD